MFVGGPFLLVAVLMSVHFYSIYIIYFQPGNNDPINRWRTFVATVLERVISQWPL